jgi:predicted MFS family arabinose efflux permease
LIGVVGVVAAPLVGRAGDRWNPRHIVGAGTVIAALSFILFGLSGHRLWGLVAGVIVMDLGVQVVHVTNQTRNQSLRPEARNRLNTVYMFSYFIGGVVGSSLGAVGWAVAGWAGVCTVGISFPTLALGVYVLVAPTRHRLDVTEAVSQGTAGE